MRTLLYYVTSQQLGAIGMTDTPTTLTLGTRIDSTHSPIENPLIHVYATQFILPAHDGSFQQPLNLALIQSDNNPVDTSRRRRSEWFAGTFYGFHSGQATTLEESDTWTSRIFKIATRPHRIAGNHLGALLDAYATKIDEGQLRVYAHQD